MLNDTLIDESLQDSFCQSVPLLIRVNVIDCRNKVRLVRN